MIFVPGWWTLFEAMGGSLLSKMCWFFFLVLLISSLLSSYILERCFFFFRVRNLVSSSSSSSLLSPSFLQELRRQAGLIFFCSSSDDEEQESTPAPNKLESDCGTVALSPFTAEDEESPESESDPYPANNASMVVRRRVFYEYTMYFCIFVLSIEY